MMRLMVTDADASRISRHSSKMNCAGQAARQVHGVAFDLRDAAAAIRN
jgi:protein required for attachment to host cells